MDRRKPINNKTMKKVVYIGSDQLNSKTIEEIMRENSDTVVIVNDDTLGALQIDGIEYEKRLPTQSSKTLSKLMSIGLLFGGLDLFGEQKSTKASLDSYDDHYIIKEYKLIQQKKSDLSRSKRDKIVQLFNSRFKRIEND